MPGCGSILAKFRWLAAAVGVLLIAVAGYNALGAAKRTKAPNPHWKPEGCQACHNMENGKPLPITAAQADEICLKCHDGEKASAEFHPVGREFDAPHFAKPADWPLVDKRLACLTCHNMKPACDASAVRPSVNRMLLRQGQDAKGKNRPFCLNCHEEGAYQKINPHVMLLTEKDEVIEDKCLFCHSKPMDRKAMKRTGDSALKAPQGTLCKDCHKEHKDPMQQSHIGMKLSPDMLAHMYAREVTGLSARLGDQLLNQAKTAGLMPTKMVPDKDGTIACSTCHNPHQSGVFSYESPLSFRAMKTNSEGKLVSPVRGQLWCRHCHDF